MSDKSSAAFRAEAERLGLTVPYGTLPRFSFDLNSGEIWTKPDAGTVYRLVELARTYATAGLAGEHCSLLALVGGRRRLGNEVVHWLRAGPEWTSGSRGRPAHLITLEEWLREQGFETKHLYE
jgi:hypothetical protein